MYIDATSEFTPSLTIHRRERCGEPVATRTTWRATTSGLLAEDQLDVLFLLDRVRRDQNQGTCAELDQATCVDGRFGMVCRLRGEVVYDRGCIYVMSIFGLSMSIYWETEAYTRTRAIDQTQHFLASHLVISWSPLYLVRIDQALFPILHYGTTSTLACQRSASFSLSGALVKAS